MCCFKTNHLSVSKLVNCSAKYFRYSRKLFHFQSDISIGQNSNLFGTTKPAPSASDICVGGWVGGGGDVGDGDGTPTPNEIN